MVVLDANILLYTYDRGAEHHAATRRWLDNALSGAEPVGIPWLTLWAFIRISTNAHLARNAVSRRDAFAFVRLVTGHAGVVIVEPGPRHAEILEALANEGRVLGSSMTDAAIAAIAIEYGATLASTDRGFARFKRLRWVNPPDLEG
jgi:toxin-antitoxin system PIN domain toxin